MVQIFPVTTTLPAPNWVDEPKLSIAASAKTKMLNGAVSTLRFSDTQSGGSLVIHWDEITDTQLSELMTFWRLVDTVESFTLPTAFWRTEWLAGRVANYQAISATGLWRFREEPKWVDLNLHSYQIMATIEASLT